MTASQPTWRHAAAVRRAARRVTAALRAIHDEQALMWELFWQSSPVAAVTLIPQPGRLADGEAAATRADSG
jgi:hypothetical protein